MLIKPKFWDQKKISPYSIILYPLSLILMLKNFVFHFIPKKKFRIKSICVGNIYLGGTGKTPLVIKLYELLNNNKFNVATAKKDYKNQRDEQILLKKHSKFLKASSRKKIFVKAMNNKIDLLLFDDGLQEFNIDYDLKFVCFKNKTFIGNGRIIPAGPLREKLSSIKKYDAIFLNGDKNCLNNIKIIKDISVKIPIFLTNYKIVNLNSFQKSTNYYLFSGIGDPSSLKEILIKNDIKIIKEKIYPDHYCYSVKEIQMILNEAKQLNAKIITTEKDYVKIPIKYKKKINIIKIDLVIKNQNRLLNLIKNTLNEKN